MTIHVIRRKVKYSKEVWGEVEKFGLCVYSLATILSLVEGQQNLCYNGCTSQLLEALIEDRKNAYNN